MAEHVSSPFTAFVGAVIEERSEGYARLALVTGPQHADVNGNVHRGVMTTVMDSVIGIGLGTMRGERGTYRPHATIEMSTSFHTQATPGDELVMDGRVTHVTDRVAFGEAETRRRSDNRLIAKAHITFALPAPRA